MWADMLFRARDFVEGRATLVSFEELGLAEVEESMALDDSVDNSFRRELPTLD